MAMVTYLFTGEALADKFCGFVNKHVSARGIVTCKSHTTITSRNRCNKHHRNVSVTLWLEAHLHHTDNYTVSRQKVDPKINKYYLLNKNLTVSPEILDMQTL